MIAVVLVCVSVLASCGSVSVSSGSELVQNGTFESGSIDHWTLRASADDTTAPDVFKAAVESDDYKETGAYSVKITASKYNTFVQTVKIQKDSVYYLSALVKIPSAISASDSDGLGGAFVAIDSDYSTASDITKAATGSSWKKIGVYFNSADQSSVSVRFGVGTASFNASGTAYFDQVSLVKVNEAPTGILVTNLTGAAESGRASFAANYRSNGAGVLFVTLTTVLGAALLYAAYTLLRSFMAKDGAFLKPEGDQNKISFFKSPAFLLILCELIGFAVRLVLVYFVYGSHVLSSSVTEASKLADLGAKTYYFNNTVTTPIGSLYLLWVLGLLADPLKLVTGSMGFAIFIKIPAILADLVTIFLVYYVANRKYNQYISAVFAGTYALLPVFFFASAGWGAYSSIGAMFILLSLLSILDKKYVGTVVYFSLALLFMAEAMLLLPILLVYLFYVFFKSDDYKMQISISITASVIILYLLSLPFIFSYFAAGRPFVVIARYCQAFLTHTGFTENAFTVYGLLGLGAQKANVASYVFNGVFVALSMIYAILLFFKSRSRLDLILLSAFVFAVTFVLTSAVDPFMIYPALVLLLIYGMISGDRRVLKLFGGFSVTALLNASYAMMIGGYFGTGTNSARILMTAGDPVLIIFSVVNVLLLFYFAYVTFSLSVKEEVKGVVIIRGNYFHYLGSQCKKCLNATRKFFKETIPSLFKKKEKQDAGENQ